LKKSVIDYFDLVTKLNKFFDDDLIFVSGLQTYKLKKEKINSNIVLEVENSVKENIQQRFDFIQKEKDWKKSFKLFLDLEFIWKPILLREFLTDYKILKLKFEQLIKNQFT